MLSCRDLDVLTPAGAPLIRSANVSFAHGRLHALIGPSGCGKSTLLRGLLRTARGSGEVRLHDRLVRDSADLAGHVGFVPQFSIAQPLLTVRENLAYARLLFADDTHDPAAFDRQLELIGLSRLLDRPAGLLSGGQLRRLGLALELVTAPSVLLCDEVTSGLDPASEEEILAVLRRLTDEGMTVVCVIHNLHQLDRFDRVHLLAAGRHLFSGPPRLLRELYSVADYTRIYSRLDPAAAAFVAVEDSPVEPQPALATTRGRPGLAAQTAGVLRRRLVLFFRDRGHLALTAALTFGFPCLVVVFALKGLPDLREISLQPSGSLIDQMRDKLAYQADLLRTGSLVSGLVMFQTILLALMGANNGAREIAGERAIWEKERLSGLRPSAYASAKIVFVATLCALQGLWMTFFVKAVCDFPGASWQQAASLGLCTVAMGLCALAVSAWSANAEKASLLATYLVGFQLPLSGVVLALPDWLAGFCRPAIAAYWGWSGYIDAMRDSRLYDAVFSIASARAVSPAWALGALGVQALLACATLAWALRRR